MCYFSGLPRSACSHCGGTVRDGRPAAKHAETKCNAEAGSRHLERCTESAGHAGPHVWRCGSVEPNAAMGDDPKGTDYLSRPARGAASGAPGQAPGAVSEAALAASLRVIRTIIDEGEARGHAWIRAHGRAFLASFLPVVDDAKEPTP